jgi:rubrerythrin
MGKDFDALIGFILLVVGTAAVIKIIDEATKQTRYLCPHCNGVISRNQNPCPYCRAPIRWI